MSSRQPSPKPQVPASKNENDLVDLGYNAVDLAKSIGSHMGGGGGGKADSAQAGGRESEKLSEAISIVPSLLNKG